MIKGGIGGAHTLSGLRFEARINLAAVLNDLPGYHVENNQVLLHGKLVATLYPKQCLYRNLLIPQKIDYKDYISKRLLPDEAILVGHTLHIIEMKFQNVAGSVDEKLQTCDFKNKQYHKLMSPLGIDVKYMYVLSDWFNAPEYKDVLEYIRSVGCYYYFNEIPLAEIGLPIPTSGE